ncbi:YtrH family sporulation protein [Halalkalibacter krulwichiae]|uniref:Sporulation membrane protein YtrH n=1 Tax=Halalkalibacter krulwichiae TaxID=199441 RepID=A0A1X9ME28_9BACI|nr:YtrH family sporulation protein [Halalkalibacter krulwichiae]ARK31707.1 Sporulation membrane protein YtrH [Halalkalibacter krulwichiae]
MLSRELLATLIVDFFVAFGVIIGGAIIGGIGAFLIGKPPLSVIHDLAGSLKIWAIVAAIGGTFDAITNIERGLFYGTHDDIFKTGFMILAALCGAHSGTVLIQWLVGETLSS